MQAEEVTALDIINAAIDRLQRTGWRQGDSGEEEGPNCLSGALDNGFEDLTGTSLSFLDGTEVAHYVYVNRQVRGRVREAIRNRTDDLSQQMSMVLWNDAPQRTYEDVILLLKEVRGELENNDSIIKEQNRG